MARKLETTELAAIGLNVIVPGAGHMIQGEGTTGVLFLLFAFIGAFCGAGVGWPLIGAVAAVHLYTVLAGKEPVKELPTVDFKSLPKKEEPEEEPEPAKEEPKAEAEPEAEPEPEPEEEPEEEPEAEPEPEEEPEAEPEPEEEEEEEPKEEFARTESKSKIPAFKLSIPKPGEVSEAEADWPELIPYLTKKLKAVQDSMAATEEFLTEREKTYKATTPNIPDTCPTLLREVATELGGAEFESMWSHGWAFAAGQTVSLFQMLEKDDKAWRFAHDKDDPSALALLWIRTGEVVKRTGTETTVIAEDLGAFIDQLAAGFRVAQASVATQAVMEADLLVVLPADEVGDEQGSEDAEFPDFWMGASGPGVKNVGWSFEHPTIRNPKGSRLADKADCAIIEVFHEWLTTDAESPDGALEIAKMADNNVRPVGKVLLDGEVKVAWWGESPPEEVDAFVDHLRGLVYAEG